MKKMHALHQLHAPLRGPMHSLGGGNVCNSTPDCLALSCPRAPPNVSDRCVETPHLSTVELSNSISHRLRTAIAYRYHMNMISTYVRTERIDVQTGSFTSTSLVQQLMGSVDDGGVWSNFEHSFRMPPCATWSWQYLARCTLQISQGVSW